jgi:hypothetical protein
MRKGKWIGTRIGYAHKGAWRPAKSEQRQALKLRILFGHFTCIRALLLRELTSHERK